MQTILIWDLPTRVFHWLFALGFAVAWLTAEWDAAFSIHMLSGVLMLGLVLFRLAWGLLGGRYSRFASFAHGPRAGLAYLRALLDGSAGRYLGHNPAGSQAIWLLLGLAPVVTLAGLGAWAGSAWPVGEVLGEGHELLANLMLLVVLLHLAGVAAESLLHRENLVAGMLHGRKAAPEGTPASSRHGGIGTLLLVAVLVSTAGWLRYAEVAAPVGHGHGAEDREAGEHQAVAPARPSPARAGIRPDPAGRPAGEESGMGGTGAIIRT